MLGLGFEKCNGKLYCIDTWINDAMTEGTWDTYQYFIDNTKLVSLGYIPTRTIFETLETLI